MFFSPRYHPVPRSQTGVLALILRQAIESGYSWHHVQTAPKAKIVDALTKLHEKHRVFLDARARHARREAGLPVAYLVLGPCPPGDRWPMALLATKRLEGEPMHRVTDERHRLIWPAWNGQEWQPMYVLHPHPITERWTWSLTRERYRAYLEEALLYAKEGNWPKLNALLRRLGKLPSFRGVWEQRREILRRVQQAWGDLHLRTPKGQWKEPPWRRTTENWPKHPTRISVPVWGEPPITVEDCLTRNPQPEEETPETPETS